MQDFQKTYTTRQQGEELLKAGIPKWSADMKYESDDNSPTMVEAFCFFETGVIDDGYQKYTVEYQPCWSVGRLLEIYLKCQVDNKHAQMVFIEENITFIERLINEIKVDIETKRLDLSRLED